LSRGDLPVLLVVPVVVFVLVLWLQSLLSCSQSSAFRCSQLEQHTARPRSSCWPSASTEHVSSLLLTGPLPLCTTGICFSSARSVCYSCASFSFHLLIWFRAGRFPLGLSSPLVAFPCPRTRIWPDDFLLPTISALLTAIKSGKILSICRVHEIKFLFGV
jgi:hypothetical protein